MKRITSYIIALMMVLTLVPYTAFAGTDRQAAEHINLYITQPNPLYSDEARTVEVIDKSKTFRAAPRLFSAGEYVTTTDEAAALLRAGMVKRQDLVVIDMKITSEYFSEEALEALTDEIYEKAFDHTGNSAEGDALLWVYESCNGEVGAHGNGTDFYATLTFYPTYYTTAEQEEELSEAIEALKAELNLGGKTDYEKIKAIYDYMTLNITYDYANLEDNSYMLKFTAYAALIDKTAVCQGYAILLYRLALEYGIDCRVITGASRNSNGDYEGHAWNIVKLDGKYYNLDATWDSTYDYDKKNHDFFLKGSGTFKNHMSNNVYKTAEFKAAYPISKTDYVINDDIVYGDCSGDGIVNVKDAVLVLQYANKKITGDNLNLSVSDVNGDSKINVKDAAIILQYVNKKIDIFPIEQ